MRSIAGVVLLMSFLILFEGCKKQPGHFSGHPAMRSRTKTPAANQNINDCDVLEKKRSKQARESQKPKKVVKIPPSEKGKPGRSVVEKEKSKKSYLKKKSKGKKKKKKGIPFALKVGLVALIALGAIGFVVVSVVIALLTLALSIVFVPLIISIASFVISSIAFGFIKIYESFQRRRRRREEREMEERENRLKEEKNQEEVVPEEENENTIEEDNTDE
jgi:membrane protein implicated in regulation of membrane protease activity